MSEKTWILGKDVALEDSIAALKFCLENLGFDLVVEAWLNPVPKIWSVAVQDADCSLCLAEGTGTSREAALASALGEFVERLACNYFFANYYMGPQKSEHSFYHYSQERWFDADETWPEGLIDDPSLQALYNANGTLTPAQLVDNNSGDAERGVCALPYTRLSDGATQWFPVNLIDKLYASNGMSAGNNLEEARIQALAELLGHHIKSRVITEGLALPDIPEEVLARYAGIGESVAALRESGFGVLLRDASLGGKYPVISITLLNPDNGSCRASFGAHPKFEVALQRALTALLQGRDLDQLDQLNEPSFDQPSVASDNNLEAHFFDSSGAMPWSFFSDNPDVDFSDWDFSAETTEEYHWICGVFEDDGYRVYIADYDHLGFYACRVLVPGLSEIYPPADLQQRSTRAAALRPVFFNLHSSNPQQLQALVDWLDEQDFAEQQPVAALFGLAPDPGSPWDALRVGHLRLWLALALQQLENVPKLCKWAVDFGEAQAVDVRLYRCISILAGLDHSHYDAAQFESSIEALYPAELLRLARSLYSGSVKFPGLHDPGMELTDMKLHRTLIAARAKLQFAMRAAVNTPQPLT